MLTYRHRTYGLDHHLVNEDVDLTIQALYERVSECLEKLNRAAIVDDSVFELELLVTQLRIRLHAGVYDPLKTLNDSQGENAMKILALSEQLDHVMYELGARTELVTEVAALTKAILRKEGIPFRS